MAIDPEVGPFLVSSWWCCLLFTAEVFGLYYYISEFWKRDSKTLKAVVIFAFLVDTLGIAIQLAQVYFFILYSWAGKTVMATILSALTQGTNAFIVQVFLCWRFWSLSKNALVTAVLFLMSLASYVAVWGLGMREVFHSQYSDVPSYKPYLITWLSCSVLADLLIAISLVTMLTKMTNTGVKSTRSLLHKIMVLTLGTGAMTAILALCMLLDYVLNPVSNYTAIGMPLGRLYTLNVFILLLSRGNVLKGTDHSVMSGDMSLNGRSAFRINVQRTTDLAFNRAEPSNTIISHHNLEDGYKAEF